MKRLCISVCLVAFAFVHLPAQRAHAARMGRGAQGWWMGHQGVVCRDGATLAWLWEGGGYGGSSSTLRLWEGSAGTGRLIAHAPMSPTIHTTAVQFDLDELGAHGVFTSYAIRDVNWFPLLAPGVALAIEDALLGVTINTTVQNCLLASSHAPTLARGAAQTLTPLHLPSPSLAIPDDAMRYRIEALPAHGSLTLNNITLVVGSTFTQDDIAEGRLKYTHNNDAAGNDSFRYRLDGMSRVSLRRAFTGIAEADGASYAPALSANGGLVAFASDATNLDSSLIDSGAHTDVFLWQANQITQRASQSNDEAEANRPSLGPTLSANGARIAFASDATNLQPIADCPANGSDAEAHIFQRDVVDFPLNGSLTLSNTQRLSASSGMPPGCARANGTSYSPIVADDGSVAYLSGADNLLAPATDPNGSVSDAFLRSGNSTRLLTARAITTTGYFGASSLAIAGTGNNLRAAFSAADGFTASDTNGFDDVFVQAPAGVATSTIVASISFSNTPANGDSITPALSRDGRWLAFQSDASNLVAGDGNSQTDIFVRDLQTNTTVRASVSMTGGDANSFSSSPKLSADGRWVAFTSSASNLVAGDGNGYSDVFVRDLQTNQTYRLSQTASGAQANGASGTSAISEDGHHIAFASVATNLVSEGLEPMSDVDSDVFIRYLDPDRTMTISILSPRAFLPLVRR